MFGEIFYAFCMRIYIAFATSQRVMSLSGSKTLAVNWMRCWILAKLAYGAYHISVGTSSNTRKEILSRASVWKVLMIILNASARVIGLFGLNVPSEYPPITRFTFAVLAYGACQELASTSEK